MNLVLLALFACTAERAEPLRALCGSALRPPVDALTAAFEGQTGADVEVVYGGSGALLAQLELAGRGDVFVPASPEYFEDGVARGLLVPGSARTVAWLVPAIAVPEGNPAGVATLADLARPGMRVGLANPETVAVGRYAVEILEREGLLDAVLARAVTLTPSAAQLAELAALGQVDAVLGWSAFAAWDSAHLDVVGLAAGQVPRVAPVPAGIATGARDPALAARFVDLLASPDGAAVFEAHGYVTRREAAEVLAPGAAAGGAPDLPADWLARLAAARP